MWEDVEGNFPVSAGFELTTHGLLVQEHNYSATTHSPRERTKPIAKQQDAVLCGGCQKWFNSKVGLAVHKCEGEDSCAL